MLHIRRPRRGFRLREETGVVDLASIMVGVIVLGIIGGIIAAAVFVVVPWAQDQAAEQNLGAVTTAESIGYAQNQAYDSGPGLVMAGSLQASDLDNLQIASDGPGDCWVAISTSGTGNEFIASSTDPTPAAYAPGASTACNDLANPVLNAFPEATGATVASGAFPTEFVIANTQDSGNLTGVLVQIEVPASIVAPGATPTLVSYRGGSCTPESSTLAGSNEIFTLSCASLGPWGSDNDDFSIPLASSAKPGTYDYTMTATDAAGDSVSGLSTIQIEN